MSHGTRATLLAAFLGLALSGPAGPFRWMEGLQVWMSSVWGDAGSIMDPNGLRGDEGSIMDPDG